MIDFRMQWMQMLKTIIIIIIILMVISTQLYCNCTVIIKNKLISKKYMNVSVTSAQQLLHLQMEDRICWKAAPLLYHELIQPDCFTVISRNNHLTS